MASKISLVRSLIKAIEDWKSGIEAGASPSERDIEALHDMLRDTHILPLYKLATTSHLGRSGVRQANYALVGLPESAVNLSFVDLFENHIRVLVDKQRKRGGGYAAIFQALEQRKVPLVICETGTVRVAGNWEGDGQSTFIFDALISRRGGRFFSIDINLECLETAFSICSSNTNLILNDSVAALQALCGGKNIDQIDLLYLDSYDLDVKNPLPSALHHAHELLASLPCIGPGTIICIDDYGVPGALGGKGAIIDPVLESLKVPVIHSGYQKVWQLSTENNCADIYQRLLVEISQH